MFTTWAQPFSVRIRTLWITIGNNIIIALACNKTVDWSKPVGPSESLCRLANLHFWRAAKHREKTQEAERHKTLVLWFTQQKYRPSIQKRSRNHFLRWQTHQCSLQCRGALPLPSVGDSDHWNLGLMRILLKIWANYTIAKTPVIVTQSSQETQYLPNRISNKDIKQSVAVLNAPS